MSSIQIHFHWPASIFYLYAGEKTRAIECVVQSFFGSVHTKRGIKFDMYRRITRIYDEAQQTLKVYPGNPAEEGELRLYYDPECKVPSNIAAYDYWGGAKLSHNRSKSDVSTTSV